MKVKACVLDTETTGFQPPIIPIQLVYMPLREELNKISPWKAKCFEEMFRPDRSIEYGAMAAHGITHADLLDAPSWNDYKFPVEADYYIGHNVDYDMDNVRPAMTKGFETKHICTFALAQLAFPAVDSHKLAALAYFLQDNGLLPAKYVDPWEEYIRNAHGAEADVHMCAGLLMAIAEKLGATTWDKMHEYSEVARIPTIMPFGKHKGMEIRKVPSDYRRWLSGQSDVDRNLLKALTMPAASWDQHMELVRQIRGE